MEVNRGIRLHQSALVRRKTESNLSIRPRCHSLLWRKSIDEKKALRGESFLSALEQIHLNQVKIIFLCSCFSVACVNCLVAFARFFPKLQQLAFRCFGQLLVARVNVANHCFSKLLQLVRNQLVHFCYFVDQSDYFCICISDVCLTAFVNSC